MVVVVCTVVVGFAVAMFLLAAQPRQTEYTDSYINITIDGKPEVIHYRDPMPDEAHELISRGPLP